MSLNKVITSVNALANSVSIPNDQLNNVVCIDTVNNRIGVQTANPSREIDISGMLKTNYIYLNNENNITNEYDISYDKNYMSLSRGLEVKEGISCENIICNSLNLSYITSDISFEDNVDINGFVNILGNLTVLGELRESGTNLVTSDDRYKHNEKLIENGLEIIRQLKPQIYNKTLTFKEENYRGELNIEDEPYKIEAGLIAQEVNIINDLSYSVLDGNEEEPFYLNYNNIFVYGLAGIKELDKIVNENRNKNINDISNLSNKNIEDISNLSNKIDKIKYGTQDISDINIINIQNVIKNQNILIQSLNSKIINLESRINNLENK